MGRRGGRAAPGAGGVKLMSEVEPDAAARCKVLEAVIAALVRGMGGSVRVPEMLITAAQGRVFTMEARGDVLHLRVSEPGEGN